MYMWVLDGLGGGSRRSEQRDEGPTAKVWTLELDVGHIEDFFDCFGKFLLPGFRV
jgi:hypothetical protein